jgi:hypothetical protein
LKSVLVPPEPAKGMILAALGTTIDDGPWRRRGDPLATNEWALAEWEGEFVTIYTISEQGHRTGAPPLTGRIQSVGNDGFVLQPADSSSSSSDTDEQAPPVFFPWHSVNCIARRGVG